MPRHGFVRLRLVAAAAVLAAGLSPSLPAAADPDVPQETVVPATLRSTYTSGALYGGSAYAGNNGAGSQGVFHSLEGFGLVWTRYADGRSAKVVRSGRVLQLRNGRRRRARVPLRRRPVRPVERGRRHDSYGAGAGGPDGIPHRLRGPGGRLPGPDRRGRDAPQGDAPADPGGRRRHARRAGHRGVAGGVRPRAAQGRGR